MHILTSSYRSKGKQTIKFSQLIENHMRNIILEKSFTKCGQNASARPFSKKSKLSISLDQQSEILYSLFIQYAHQGGSRTAATSKVELFVIIVNGFQPFTIFIKSFPFGCCSSPRSASGPCQDLLKHIKTKVQNILFYLI